MKLAIKTEAVSSLPSSPRRIKIFKSFEEARQDKINYIINQSPVERLRKTVELTLRVYNVTKESLKDRKRSNRIHIITKPQN